MFDFRLKDKGVALLAVLMTIFVVVILANIALNVMVSQGRLTHHKVNRIQAYYASWAAINYAQEMLRLGPAAGGWAPNSCPAPGCALPNDADIPSSVIQPIMIVLTPSGQPGCVTPSGVTCISVNVQYINPSP